MKTDSVKLMYFSPTGTTKAVAQSIAHGFHPESLDVIDITKTDNRKQPLHVSDQDVLLVAVPVYMGRVPALATQWLETLQAKGTPTVCVVVYGNRAYEDALLELKNIVEKCGCIPVAYGAYIGEHSFSNPEEPVAQGRPDAQDLKHAEKFGQKIREKLLSLASISEVADVEIPGVFPYRKDAKLWTVDFIAVNDTCVQCGTCAGVCPVDAIDPEDSRNIDQEKCITCCACIKNCPQQARTIKPSPVKDAAKRLHTLCSEPKMPENYL